MSHPIINTLRTEWGYLGKRRKIFIFYIFLFVLAGAIVNLLTPYVIGSIFNSIQNSISTKEELSGLLLKISLLLAITVVFWILHGTARVLETTTSFHVRKNYVNDKIRTVLRLPIKWHKDNHSGDTIDKINRAANAVEDFSGQMTYQIVYGLISFLGSIIILLVIDWRIGSFALGYSFLILFIISLVDKRLDKRYRELNTYSNKLSATVFDYISNIITVITLRLKKKVTEDIEEKQIASYRTFRSSSIINELKWGFASVSIQFMIVAVLIYKTYTDFSANGLILIGSLYMVYGYLTNVGETFYKFADLYGMIIRANAKITGAYPLDEAYQKLESPQTFTLPKHWKEVSLKSVCFTYDQEEGKAKHLENISLKFKRGDKIAFVGESGSGKSTTLTLIRGLYPVDAGEIFCDGAKLPGGIKHVQDHVTLIPQEPEIFNNTFRHNITMGLSTNEAELNKVIEMSQLNSVLQKLPNGLETSVMEKGVSLSGGEKQRLALARGLLAGMKSDIILMDEPTSSVDSLNELKIHESVFEEFQDKTIISSIHRLHLLDKFDYIYLFSKGKIVGKGTFEEIKKDPLFSKMWRRYTQEKVLDKKLVIRRKGRPIRKTVRRNR